MRDIYSYVTEQESGFKNPINLEDGWTWNFKEHIRKSYLYKNSQFLKDNEDRKDRPFKNIIRPILNIQYRTEGFDVKDIELYVNNADNYYKSILVKKYHDKWALKNEMDTFIDEVVESFVDYGGVLVKNVDDVRPEVVDFRTIAFCDQTDFLSGAFAIKHFLSASQLKDMEDVGWGKTENGANITLEQLVLLSESEKDIDKSVGTTKTPSKYVEVYEVHNVSELDYDLSSKNSDPQMWIIGFYKDEKGGSHGVTLFKNKEPKLPFKFLKRDPIQGRALGFGGVEELFEAQTWTNSAEIAIAEMLNFASKVWMKTTDPKFKGQNLKSSANGKIFDIQPNTDINQIDNSPRNLVAFDNQLVKMHEHAKEMGAASDINLNKEPTSGTPFKSVEAQLAEGNSLHLWRQGRIAVFMDEIYRDWVIPQIGREIAKGDKFLAEFSVDEMQKIADSITNIQTNEKIKGMMLSGKQVTKEMQQEFSNLTRQEFLKQGRKRFVEILKKEFSANDLDVFTNIAGKQKDLAKMTDKLVNLVREFIAAPQVRQDPEIAKVVNEVLEKSGLSPITYGLTPSPYVEQKPVPTEPLKALVQPNG